MRLIEKVITLGIVGCGLSFGAVLLLNDSFASGDSKYWLVAFSSYVGLGFFYLLYRESSTRAMVLDGFQESRTALRKRESTYFQNVSRILDNEAEESLVVHWADCLHVAACPEHVRYLAYRANNLEKMCVGRLASEIQDVVARMMVVEALCHRKELRYLEIGVLHGTSAVILYDYASTLFAGVRMVLVDPLDGYYGKGESDPYTGVPVTESTLSRNLRIGSVPKDDVQLIRAKSSDDQARRRSSIATYDYVFVDGDHSYEGLREDVTTYGRLLDVGGYLVIDDYECKSWPDVTSYVDRELRVSAEYSCVGHVSNTIVFRRRMPVVT